MRSFADFARSVGELFGRQSRGNRVAGGRSIFETLSGSDFEPSERFSVIAPNALAQDVHTAKPVLRHGIALLSAKTVPSYRFAIVAFAEPNDGSAITTENSQKLGPAGV